MSICIHCNAWGCTRCRPPTTEDVARLGGEQGPDSHDIEVARLRDLLRARDAELASARAQIELLEATVHHASRQLTRSLEGL